MRRDAFLLVTAALAVALVHGCGVPLEINAEPDPPATSPDGAGNDGAVGDEHVEEGGDSGGAVEGGAADGPVDAPLEAEQIGTPKVVFVLSIAVLPATAVLDENNVARVGRDGFDGRCRAEAKAAGLPGTFVAWMSVSTGNGANAIDRLNDGNSWFLPSGGPAAGPSADLVFQSKASIVATGPQIGIARGANGTLIVPSAGEDRVWTGTDNNGHYLAALSCGDWLGSGAMGRWGQFNSVGLSSWTSANTTACTNAYRAICFQQ